ncbi:arsenate reductase [Ignatzschineria ureiclastica]|nr:arsenate reductase [Ignatzschineria ureiclastica]GGZ94866.1 arsenate reductase [Ignatzschineria ureiclastica]
MIVYGIKNCNTMKKAFTWLDEHHIAYEFVDYRNPGLSTETLQGILKLIDLDDLVNKRSTSWRALSDSDKEAVLNPATAIAVLQAHPTLIKRPLIVEGSKAYVGFSEEAFTQQFVSSLS